MFRLLKQNGTQVNNNNNIFERRPSPGEVSKGDTMENVEVKQTSCQDGLSQDLNEAVPETERLDSKALKTRAQLSVKNRRQRPTRTRLYDSVSSTDGEDSLERKVSTLNGWQTLAECRCPPVYLLNVIEVLLICALLGRKSPKFVFNSLYGCHLNPFLHSVR